MRAWGLGGLGLWTRDSALGSTAVTEYDPAMAGTATLARRRTPAQARFRRWLARRPPDDLNHYELLDGHVVMAPPAGWPHAGIEATIAARVHAHVAAHELGIVLGSSAGYDLPSGDTLEPDVSFITAARFAAGPAPVRRRFLRIVPTLAVEILSPSTAARDRTAKRRIYARNGVDEYWLVDPDAHSVTVYRLRRHTYDRGTTITTGDVQSRVLPALGLAVADIFAGTD